MGRKLESGEVIEKLKKHVALEIEIAELFIKDRHGISDPYLNGKHETLLKVDEILRGEI